jgi:WD40 repeat protein
MPPRKDNLSAVPKPQTEVVKRWIDQGAKLDGGIDPKADLTFTPDGKQLVIGGHHELTVWEASTGKLLKRIHTRAERAYAMAFLPDGKLAVAGGRPGQEGDVRIFDINGPGKSINGVLILDGVNDAKVMVKQLADTDDSVLCLAVSPDGKKIASGGCDRTVRVWEYPSCQLEQSIENHADWVLGIAFAADGKHLLTRNRS